MTEATLIDLVERVKRSTGPDRELDCRVWCAQPGQPYDGNFDLFRSVVPDFGQWLAPYYTADLNAAMTLIPKDQPITCDFLRDRPSKVKYAGGEWVRGNTPQHALIAASLEAELERIRV